MELRSTTYPSILFDLTSFVRDARQVGARRTYGQSGFGVKVLHHAISPDPMILAIILIAYLNYLVELGRLSILAS